MSRITRVHRVSWLGILLLCGLVLNAGPSYAGQQKPPGHSIGQVSTNGDVIVIELDRAALGPPNLFDLVGRTLRFSPAGSRYRVTNQTLQLDGGIASAIGRFDRLADVGGTLSARAPGSIQFCRRRRASNPYACPV